MREISIKSPQISPDAMIYRKFNTPAIMIFAILNMPHQAHSIQTRHQISDSLLRQHCSEFITNSPRFAFISEFSPLRRGALAPKYIEEEYSPERCEGALISAPLPEKWLPGQKKSAVSFYFFNRSIQECRRTVISFDFTPFLVATATLDSNQKLQISFQKKLAAPPASLQMFPRPLFSDTNEAHTTIIQHTLHGTKIPSEDLSMIKKTYGDWISFKDFVPREITNKHYTFFLWLKSISPEHSK